MLVSTTLCTNTSPKWYQMVMFSTQFFIKIPKYQHHSERTQTDCLFLQSIRIQSSHSTAIDRLYESTSAGSHMREGLDLWRRAAGARERTGGGGRNALQPPPCDAHVASEPWLPLVSANLDSARLSFEYCALSGFACSSRSSVSFEGLCMGRVRPILAWFYSILYVPQSRKYSLSLSIHIYHTSTWILNFRPQTLLDHIEESLTSLPAYRAVSVLRKKQPIRVGMKQTARFPCCFLQWLKYAETPQFKRIICGPQVRNASQGNSAAGFLWWCPHCGRGGLFPRE